MAAGNALLALAGPIGWGIAGAALLSSIVIFSAKKTKLNKEKNEEILAVKENTLKVTEMNLKIHQILQETMHLRNGINQTLKTALKMYGGDYLSFNDEQKFLLGSLINNTKALSAMFGKTVEAE